MTTRPPRRTDGLKERIEWVEDKLERLETKWDTKLDTLQDRINLLIIAAAATLASVTLALFILLLAQLNQ